MKEPDSKPMTVEELIEILQTVPPDLTWEAYEGECSGIRLDTPDDRQYGFIHEGSRPRDNKQWRGLQVGLF